MYSVNKSFLPTVTFKNFKSSSLKSPHQKLCMAISHVKPDVKKSMFMEEISSFSLNCLKRCHWEVFFFFFFFPHSQWGFPCGSDGIVCLQCGRTEFNPWVRKIPWIRKWQPTPVYLPGECHGLRSLVGYSPWGCKELDTTEVTEHTCMVRRLCWLWCWCCQQTEKEMTGSRETT